MTATATPDDLALACGIHKENIEALCAGAQSLLGNDDARPGTPEGRAYILLEQIASQARQWHATCVALSEREA